MSLPPTDPMPPTAVPEMGRWRTFTARYKGRILRLADVCERPGAVSAFLRREGPHSLHLPEWRKARERGALTGGSKPPALRPPSRLTRDRRVVEIERANANLKWRAPRAEAMVTRQEGVFAQLETLANDEPFERAGCRWSRRRSPSLASLKRARASARHGPASPDGRRRCNGPPLLRRSTRALAREERARVLATLHEPRVADHAPRELAATLVVEATRLCSVSTMYRSLRENNEVREGLDHLRHLACVAPQLLAERPNQGRKWDIMKFKGPVKGTSSNST